MKLLKEEIILNIMINNHEFITDENNKIYGIELIEKNINTKRKLFEAIQL